MLDFVGIDFETANDFRASACSMGLTKVIGGAVIESRNYIFKPPVSFDSFNWRQMRIHRITSEMVKDLGRFGDYWPEIYEFISEMNVVAHNASFDISVLRSSLRASNIPVPDLQYACTLVMSRIAYDLSSYRLPVVAKAAGVVWDSSRHHNAEFDSLMAAQITLSMANELHANSLLSLTQELNVRLGYIADEYSDSCISLNYESRPRQASRQYKSAKLVPINLEADSSHPLYGKSIAITGLLSSMSKGEAWHEAGNLGAKPRDNVTRTTDVLVVAQQDLSDFLQGKSASNKFQYAEKLRASGIPIEIMGEEDFIYLINWKRAP